MNRLQIIMLALVLSLATSASGQRWLDEKFHSFANLPQEEAEALRAVARTFVTAVTNQNLVALQAMLHPDFVASLSSRQLDCVQGFDLSFRLCHQINPDYTLRYARLTQSDVKRLKKEGGGPWSPTPTIVLSIEFKTGPDTGKELHLMLAHKKRWHLLARVPDERRMAAYDKMLNEIEQRKQEGSNKPAGR